jgi:hypothetical protein
VQTVQVSIDALVIPEVLPSGVPCSATSTAATAPTWTLADAEGSEADLCTTLGRD